MIRGPGMVCTMTRACVAVICCLLVASCSTPAATPTATARPSDSPQGAASPSPVETESPSENLAELCSATRLDAGPFIALARNDALGCFGSRTVEVAGYLSAMGGVGGCTEQLIPGDGWLDLCGGPQRILVADLNDDEGLTIYLSPTIDQRDAPRGSVALLSGHFDDPAAASCGVEGGDDAANVAARENCRLAFVIEMVTAIR